MVQFRRPMNQEYESCFEWNSVAILYEVENFSTFSEIFRDFVEIYFTSIFALGDQNPGKQCKYNGLY